MSFNDSNKSISENLIYHVNEVQELIQAGNIQEMGVTAGKIEKYVTSLSEAAQKARSKYHNREVEYLNEGKSAAESEKRAKASAEYRLYKRYDALVDRGESAIQTLKKWADRLSEERKNADL